jgi:hypothetical protein
MLMTTCAPGLMMPDFSSAISAEQLRVIEVHRHDHADHAVGDIGRIPRAAQADLDHSRVDGRVGEYCESEPGEDLEERHARSTRGLALPVDHVEVGGEFLVGAKHVVLGDRLAVEADALASVQQVRAGVEAGAQAVCPEERLDHASRRRLAIRARDVDDREGPLRPAEQVDQRADPIEARLHLVLWPAGEQRRIHVECHLCSLRPRSGAGPRCAPHLG